MSTISVIQERLTFNYKPANYWSELGDVKYRVSVLLEMGYLRFTRREETATFTRQVDVT